MTTTAPTSPQIRTIAYEPALVMSAATCPSCGTMFGAGTPEPAIPAPRPAEPVANPPDGRELRVPLAQVLRLILEVIDGRRIVRQLAAIASPCVVRYVGAMATGHRAARPARLLSVRVCRPTEQGAEVAAVVQLDDRTRAIAARFERASAAAWHCEAFRVL